MCNLVNTRCSVAAHQSEVHFKEGNHLLDKLDAAFATSLGTFTPTSASTRMGPAIERPRAYNPRVAMDWMANHMRDTRTRPRSVERKAQIKVNIFAEQSITAVGDRTHGPALDALDGTTLANVVFHGKKGV